MPESGDIWERYDAKVVQIQQLEGRLSALERELAAGKHERDHWARVARQSCGSSDQPTTTAEHPQRDRTPIQ